METKAALKILHNPKASKASLREALAFALGVEYAPPKEPEKSESVFTRCKTVFCDAYKRQNGFPYQFAAREGKALKDIIEKVNGIANHEATDEALILTFTHLIDKLPDWYKQNAFSLPVINSKFNEIVTAIKKNGSEKRQSGISDEYKANLFRDIQPG
jgi:hypothetical protein